MSDEGLIRPGAVCSECGQVVQEDLEVCPNCSAALPVKLDLTPEQRSSLEELARLSNETLATAGAESAELSFGLGCALGALPIIAVVVILYLTGVFNIIISLVVVALGALVVAGTAGLVASFARTRRIGTAYQINVGPQIDRQLKNDGQDRWTFDRVAEQTLTSDAPLLERIRKQPEP
jgi:hypothetical protein